MFFKVLFYVIAIIIIIGASCKISNKASLYKSKDNAFEIIFPVWNWSKPTFYLFVDEKGYRTQIPDDLPFRYAEEEYNTFVPKKEDICKKNGPDSDECIKAEEKLEDLKINLEDAYQDLKDIIAEKGDEALVSPKFEREKLVF